MSEQLQVSQGGTRRTTGIRESTPLSRRLVMSDGPAGARSSKSQPLIVDELTGRLLSITFPKQADREVFLVEVREIAGRSLLSVGLSEDAARTTHVALTMYMGARPQPTSPWIPPREATESFHAHNPFDKFVVEVRRDGQPPIRLGYVFPNPEMPWFVNIENLR